MTNSEWVMVSSDATALDGLQPPLYPDKTGRLRTFREVTLIPSQPYWSRPLPGGAPLADSDASELETHRRKNGR
jgi:hypothetical protein